MRCEEIDYPIFGNDMQVVAVELDPGETVIAEAEPCTGWIAQAPMSLNMGDESAGDSSSAARLA